jgi:tRNA pseudouridine38-40 synthase
MVRNIVGTLVHISSKQNINPEYISQILEAKDRSKAFQTAPAHGLYLKEIIY